MTDDICEKYDWFRLCPFGTCPLPPTLFGYYIYIYYWCDGYMFEFIVYYAEYTVDDCDDCICSCCYFCVCFFSRYGFEKA